MIDEPTIPCRICSNPTPMLGTRLCDRCWELEKRIHANPELAQRILDSMIKPTPADYAPFPFENLRTVGSYFTVAAKDIDRCRSVAYRRNKGSFQQRFQVTKQDDGTARCMRIV